MFMVLDMLKNKQDKVIVFQLAKVLDHKPFDEWLQLAVDQGLKKTKSGSTR